MSQIPFHLQSGGELWSYGSYNEVLEVTVKDIQQEIASAGGAWKDSAAFIKCMKFLDFKIDRSSLQTPAWSLFCKNDPRYSENLVELSN